MLRALLRSLLLLLACIALVARADDAAPPQREYLPKSGTGRVVVVISGQTGASNYTSISQDFADAGYYTVLVDGNDLWIKSGGGGKLLLGVIERAQASPHALPGKVGVVAFSLGGAAGLTYATRMPEHVATVVVMYPLTNFIKEPDDFVGKIKVPTLMLAGTADTYKSCCVIEKARELADAARKNPDVAPLFVLHEYEGADHGFNMNTSHQRALVADSRDRAIAQLRQYLVDR
jgi:dienelactone hydrolase